LKFPNSIFVVFRYVSTAKMGLIARSTNHRHARIPRLRRTNWTREVERVVNLRHLDNLSQDEFMDDEAFPQKKM
jgi:hypothetical protein